MQRSKQGTVPTVSFEASAQDRPARRSRLPHAVSRPGAAARFTPSLSSLRSGPGLRSHSAEKMPRRPRPWRLRRGRRGAGTSRRGRRRPRPSGRVWTGWTTQVRGLSSTGLARGSPRCRPGASWPPSGRPAPPAPARVGVCPCGAAEPPSPRPPAQGAPRTWSRFPRGRFLRGPWDRGLLGGDCMATLQPLSHVGRETMPRTGQKR